VSDPCEALQRWHLGYSARFASDR